MVVFSELALHCTGFTIDSTDTIGRLRGALLLEKDERISNTRRHGLHGALDDRPRMSMADIPADAQEAVVGFAFASSSYLAGVE